MFWRSLLCIIQKFMETVGTDRGEKQLLEYLDTYHLNTGYMLSFNFNKKKDIGITEIKIKDKILIEAVV